jgi:hypothetical protein
VGIADLGTLASNYGHSNALWTEGDFDYNSVVSVADLGALATNYGQSLPGTGAAPAAVSASVVAAATPQAAIANARTVAASSTLFSDTGLDGRDRKRWEALLRALQLS